MNITTIFGPLALLSIFFISAQGRVWNLAGAEVGDKSYFDEVTIESADGKTWYIQAIPKDSLSNVPKVIHGPFELRGFGPYSMLILKMWLNTNVYVTVTFRNTTVAREFYQVINPHHSRAFLNEYKIKELVMYSLDGKQTQVFEKDDSKALDMFSLRTEFGVDSKIRTYVVHNTEGNQEPLLIFHSIEVEMTLVGDDVMLTISPQKSRKKHVYCLKLEDPSIAKLLLEAYKTQKMLRMVVNPQDLEALPINTYPVSVNM